MKVMIVEDEQAIRELLAETLRKWNFEVAVLKHLIMYSKIFFMKIRDCLIRY